MFATNHATVSNHIRRSAMSMHGRLYGCRLSKSFMRSTEKRGSLPMAHRLEMRQAPSPRGGLLSAPYGGY
jgi:hypothetical protein